MNARTQVSNEVAIDVSQVRKIDMKLEVAVIPVADAERSKNFYSKLGWRLDADFAVGDAFRVVQFTPPGSPGSFHFGKGVTSATPGAAKNYLVVSDIEAARTELIGRGADVSEVFHVAGPGQPALKGRDPEGHSYSSYATFSDPDGNIWLLQEITTRLPGRVDAGETTFSSVANLASTLRRAAAAHGEHEKRVGGDHSQTWPDWYAAYIVAEQAGKELPR